jgi:Ca2+-binding EF-hand superfamily protein
MANDLQIEKLDRAFDHIDANHSGEIERDDLLGLGSRVLLGFGEALTSVKGRQLIDRFDELWAEIAAHADTDVSGAISPSEFRTAMITAYIDGQQFDKTFRPAAVAIAALCDTDDDGVIGLQEFQILQAAFGTADGDAVMAFERLDTDANGALSVDELVQAAHDFYTGGDPQLPGNSLFGPL